MKKERAQEIIKRQQEFPNWGNYSKFMTIAENKEIELNFVEASKLNGQLSRARIIERISRDEDPISGIPLKKD